MTWHPLTPLDSTAEFADVVQLGNSSRVRRSGSGAATLKIAIKIFQVLCDFLGELRLGGRCQAQFRQTPPHHLSPISHVRVPSHG